MNALIITLGEFGIKELGLIGALLLIPYFIPTMIVFFKNGRRKYWILAINLLLGWTVIGWLGCLFWSGIDESEAQHLLKLKMQKAFAEKGLAGMADAFGKQEL